MYISYFQYFTVSELIPLIKTWRFALKHFWMGICMFFFIFVSSSESFQMEFIINCSYVERVFFFAITIGSCFQRFLIGKLFALFAVLFPTVLSAHVRHTPSRRFVQSTETRPRRNGGLYSVYRSRYFRMSKMRKHQNLYYHQIAYVCVRWFIDGVDHY